LTGLANRSLFRERLHEAHQRVRQGGRRSLALLHINLDRFKLLNDSLGHEVADQLLQKMSRRLVNALPEADTIARLSGDEFAVLFDAYGNLSSLARVATRLSSKLRLPLTVEGHELVVSASMGISHVAGQRPGNISIGQSVEHGHAARQTSGGKQLPVLHRELASQHA
jgi:diguanylate cyclase (GGDEF)-like protein